VERVSSLDPQDVIDFAIEFPAGWHDMPPASSASAAGWAGALSGSFGLDPSSAEGLAGLLRAVQALVVENDPADATDAHVYIPFPETAIVNGYLTVQLIWMEPDDTPESYLAEVDSHADDREPGYEIRGFQSWRAPHHEGELVGFTHLTALSDPDDTEALLEQRTVFAIFPIGSRQLVQLAFRSAFIGGFADMVTETQSIADSLRVSLGAAA
jgi:hypothetical protein